MRPIIALLGYRSESHTNYWPWLRFHDVFTHLGYDCQWVAGRMMRDSRPCIFVTWNEPACDVLVKCGAYRDGDVIIQKLTSLGAGDEHANWGTDAMSFFRDWQWNTYRRVEKFYDEGVNIHAFGCRTDTEPFPEKHRICQKLKDRIHWISWGPCLYDWNELQNMRPVMDGFRYDLGYVGMKWGGIGRGNVDTFEAFLDPLIEKYPNSFLGGRGNPEGQVSNEVHKEILRQSRLCPIIHCASWIAERGIQDRFWTVFATGRFGVVDNTGVYEFFDEDEVVCETDPGEYLEKSIYYMEHPDKQLPFIERIQKRIREEHNFYVQWGRVLDAICKENGYDK